MRFHGRRTISGVKNKPCGCGQAYQNIRRQSGANHDFLNACTRCGHKWLSCVNPLSMGEEEDGGGDD